MGLVTPRRLVQFIGTPNLEGFRDPSAAAVLTYAGGGRSGLSGLSFDDAERRQLEQAHQHTARQTQLSQARASLAIEPGAMGSPQPSGAPPGSPDAPIRVGGNVPQPVKTSDVAPVPPEQAVRAGSKGVVIVEITIGADGAVNDARNLRSIPPLDEAALDAVRRWRYEPTLLNGRPVPVIMTATVSFQ